MTSGWVKMFIGIGFCTLWRLAPFRPPNVEPVMATTMPFARRFGMLGNALFAALNMVIFDLLTSGFTQWTIVTAVTYAVVGMGASLFLGKSRGVLPYLLYAIVATIFYDAITGVVAGSLLFGMSWKEGFIGQIPFTINHLIGNSILAVALSPLVEWWITTNDALETEAIFLASKRD